MARFLFALLCVLALARPLHAQSDSTMAGVRLRFSVPPLTLLEPPQLRAPWLGAPGVPPSLAGLAWDSSVAVTVDSARSARLVARRLMGTYGARQLAAALPPPSEDSAGPGRQRGVFGLPTKYADLAMDGQARLEIRTDRLRNERCTAQQLLEPSAGCRGGFKAPRFDTEVSLVTSGVIGRRLHVNVDYDTQRDFSSANNIQVYYEGLEDEIIRRVEVGTVTFRPPASRFVTAAIPANNFGVNASFEFGALQFQALAATQKGSVVAERTYTIGQTASQPQDRQLRDVDFEAGRFFWIVDPARLPGYPAVDILSLGTSQLPPAESPSEVRVYRHRPASRNGTNPNLGGITAVGRRSDDPARFGPVQWQLLLEGTDYYRDPSNLWIVLASKLDQNDYLAVSYTTVTGARVGSFPVQDNPAAQDSLELIVRPQQDPSFPGFRHEMRQIYRVAGTDLERASLLVNLSLNRAESPLASPSSTYLALLGLALPTDASVFDRDNRLFPRPQNRDPDADQTVKDSYIVFPHLQPFSDARPGRLIPAELQDSLYRTPQYLVLGPEGPPAKFQLRLRYNAAGSGDRSTLDLNALQIREGSEHLSVGGLQLERGVDYNIDYSVGQVTFLNPDQLFGTSGVGQVNARFEERGLFAVAPTTILGLTSRYSLGETGTVNLLGIYQSEKSVYTRPPLGFEPTANLIGGINTELHFKPSVVTRFFDRLVTGGATAPSFLDVNAEYAFTRPDENRAGEAYLEEFEADAGIRVSLGESNWEFASRPQFPDGVEPIIGGDFDPADAVALSWQNLVPRAPSDPRPVELRPQDIDTAIVTTGGEGQTPETVLFLTLHADTAGGIVRRDNSSKWSLPQRLNRPRWRSMVTSLSSTGIDLSRNELLEFWVFQGNGSADSAGVQLVLDLGTVNEDALALAPDSFDLVAEDTLFTGRQYVGVNELDTERNPVTGIFNAVEDDIGILGDRPDVLHRGAENVADVPLCQRQLSGTVPVFPWGDLSSRCTNGNGLLDTEDLNSDNVLNASGLGESMFRYVVVLTDPTYFVRDGLPGWKLYRIPLRQADTLGTPNMRLIQHLRITVVAPADLGGPDAIGRFALARMRFVGSPWARRASSPILGISGALGEPHGEVVTTVISTENTELGYSSPPGIGNARSRRDGSQDLQGVQINEKSLRVLVRDLRQGERAEAYLRLPAGSQNLLQYRQLRVWARGRGVGWNEGDFQAFVKVGSDNQNFYLYHTGARSDSWEPEMLIDLSVWRRLRAEVEGRWLRGENPSGAAQCGLGEPTAFVACDGPYLVHLGSPGINPPNLAAVQEISAGIYRSVAGLGVQDTEVWVDDIRLSNTVNEIGTAVAFDARLSASDVGNASVSFVRQNGLFRQIGDDPTYRTTGALQLSSNWRLDRFLPASLGLAAPVTVGYARTDVSPILLSGTDIPAEALSGLRKPESWSATYTLALRRSRRGTNLLTRGLIDPLSVTASFTNGRAQTELSQSKSNASNYEAVYQLTMQRRGVSLPLGWLVSVLPRWLRESDGGKGLGRPLLSLVPSTVRMTSGLNRNLSELTSYQVPVSRPTDAGLRPVAALAHFWRNSAGMTWQPLGMLTLNGELSSRRDLRVYPDSTSIGRLAYAKRRFFLGIPVGVERDRNLTTSLVLTPRLSSWLRPRYVTNSFFVLARDLVSRDPVQAAGDSLGEFFLPQTLNNTRSREIGASIDLGRGLNQLAGDSSFIGKLTRRFRPLDISNRRSRTSTYDLAAFDPGLGYQLALGGRDRFLTQHGTSALSLSETRTTTFSSGAELPAGFSLTVSYSLSKINRLQRATGGFTQTDTRQREWPVGSVRWSRTLKGGPVSVLSFDATIRRREGSTVVPLTTGAAESATFSTSFSPGVQIGLRNGMAFTFGYSGLEQRTQNTGNTTESNQDDLNASLSYAFRLPTSVSRIRKQVRTSATALVSRASTCLRQRTQTDCSNVSDIRRRELRGGLDTEILRIMTGGLQFGYSLTDARHLDRRVSQIFLSAVFQVSLFSGDYR